MRRALTVAIAIFGPLGCSSSEPTCSDVEVVPLTVAITDAPSGQSICDATVTARVGDATFGASKGSDSCSYLIETLPKSPATYTVTLEATAPRHSPSSTTAQIAIDRCGHFSAAQQITIALSP